MFLFIAVVLIAFAGFLFLRSAPFGQLPTGARKQSIAQSPHFRNGQFQNLSHTPDLTEGVSYYAVIKEFLFHKSKRGKPKQPIPSMFTDLHALHPDDHVLIWMGHSSYFIQLHGKRLLVDPVLSGAASPISATTRSFPGTDRYTVHDIPYIDYLFLSHDHWDHMDYPTLKSLQPRIGKVITGLGNGAHLERWGYAPAQIIECDWNQQVALGDDLTIYTTPARHFSGRGIKRNQVLWTSFVLHTPSYRLFLGGDSGFDDHFKAIGDTHGPFDLAILECGQYDKSWKYIHMMPEEVIKAAQALRTGSILPVHWGKFQLANHAWDEPIKALLATPNTLPILTPIIGEKLPLSHIATSRNWWEEVGDV